MLGVVGLLDNHHIEELSEGVHQHVVNSISMGCTLDLSVDMRGLSWVKGIDDCIAMTFGTIVKKMACILSLTLLQHADADLHGAAVERVGVLVPGSLEVLLDGLPQFVLGITCQNGKWQSPKFCN